MIRIAICDDEPHFITQIKGLTNKVLSEAYISFSSETFASGAELCLKLQDGYCYDLVFLDINMNGMSGIEVADKLRCFFENKKTILIYISSYEKRAKEVFCFDTFRFISKPIEPDLFKKDLLSACNRLNELEEKVFSFKDISEGQCNIPLCDIIYFEITAGHKINVITKTCCHTFYGKLKEVADKLELHGFLLIHHSFLINYDHIRQISYKNVIMSNQIELIISGPKRKKIRAQYLHIRKWKEVIKWG